MARLLKILLGILAALVLLLMVTAIALPLLLDPNDLRGRISTLAQQKTGRELTIGHLGLSVFPWLRLTVDDLRLGNAAGFGTTPMLVARKAEAGVKLLALLRERRVEIDTIALDGAKLELAIDGQGVSNWQDLLERQAKPGEAEPGGDETPGRASFEIAGIELRDAGLHFSDARSGQDVRLDQVQLSTGVLGGGAAVPVKLRAHLAAAAQALDAELQLQTEAAWDADAKRLQLATPQLALAITRAAAPGQPELHARLQLDTAGITYTSRPAALAVRPLSLAVQSLRQGPEASPVIGASGSITATPQVDLAEQRYALDHLAAQIDVVGTRWPQGASGTLKLTADVLADLAESTLKVSNFSLQGLGLDVKSRQWLMSPLKGDAARFNGDLTVAAFSPKTLLPALGISLPKTHDAKVLDKLTFTAGIAGSASSISFKPLQLVLDDTTLRGELAVGDFASQALSFALTADTLDADRYLPPDTAQPPGAATDASASKAKTDDAELPTQALESINARGSLQVGRLKLDNLRFSNASWTFDARPGGRKHQQISAALYGGSGDITLDVLPGAVPGYTLNAVLKGISAAPLLLDLTGKDSVSGQGAVTLDLSSAGRTVGAVKRALNGTVAFNLVNGAVKGFNLAQIIRKGEALAQLNLNGVANVAVGDVRQTDFAEFKASGQIRNGVLLSDQLSAANPLLRLSGAGRLDLVNNTIDYLAKPVLVNTITGQGGKSLSQVAGIEIPIRLTGDLYAPKVAIDWQAALQQQAAAKLREKLGVSEDDVRQQREALRQKAKDEINKGLLKLFGAQPPTPPQR
jgi:AsmA protein